MSVNTEVRVQRIAAFSDGDTGGNPAGVVIERQIPDEPTMRQVARAVGFSETAFAAPIDGGWRVRYFAPESEVPFCGHATIALGAALALASRDRLSAMRYDLGAAREFMTRTGIVTVALVYSEAAKVFHARNAFASGGVYEDPATGAAAAALAGYLRDINWPHTGSIDIIQGEDMGSRSRLRAEISPAIGSSIRVSGTARLMGD